MKQIILISLVAILLSSCGNSNRSNDVSEAKSIAAGIKKMQPGGIATKEGGWTMTAKIGKKNWSANSIVRPELAGRIAGDNDGEGISLPYDRKGNVVGKKTRFSHNNGVDLFIRDDGGYVGIWGGYSGEMEITKVDDDWAEGKFLFTGSGSSDDKTIEVTDGFFRISMKMKK